MIHFYIASLNSVLVLLNIPGAMQSNKLSIIAVVVCTIAAAINTVNWRRSRNG